MFRKPNINSKLVENPRNNNNKTASVRFEELMSEANNNYKSVDSPRNNNFKTPSGRFEELMNQAQIDPFTGGKICKSCSEPVVGRRFVTYENGDVICYDCDVRSKVKPPRVKSAYIIVCSFCGNSIHGKRYITEPDGKLLCDKCEVNAPKCPNCERPIALDVQPKILSNNAAYHPECFTCSSCNSLIREPEFFESKSNEPMCQNCFETSKLPKCSECKKPISEAYIIIENQPLHKDCFKCNQCNEKISQTEGGFFKSSINNLPICSKCHIQNTAPKCAKCGKTVTENGATFADKHFHQACFLCVFCNTPLIKMKTTYRGKNDDETVCEPCFIDRYAPKCGKCNQPISPHIPGTKYEDKMFHIECFACGRCKKSLANKKFFKVGNIQICEACY